MMRDMLVCVLALPLILPGAVSCGTVELEERKLPGGAQSGIKDSAVFPEQVEKHLYVTGIEYPPGYDWHADPDYGYVASEVFLMKGKERILELAADEKNMVSPHPDTHRCIDGHLYTDYSTETETVIKVDGMELFRYPDREMICGFRIEDGDIYTLGTPRDGLDGWTYRRNGKIVLFKTAGYLMTALNSDNGTLWFAYAEQIGNVSGLRERYYLVRDGEAVSVGTAEDIEKVDDILLYNGEVYFTARLKGLKGHVVYIGDRGTALDSGSAVRTIDCKLHYDGGEDLYVSGVKQFGTDEPFYMDSMWKNYRLDFNYQSATDVQAYFLNGDDMNYVMTDVNGGSERLKIVDSGHLVDYGNDDLLYSFLGQACGVASDGHLYLALHPKYPDGKPALLTDGVLEKYDFNGYFTSVSVFP